MTAYSRYELCIASKRRRSNCDLKERDLRDNEKDREQIPSVGVLEKPRQMRDRGIAGLLGQGFWAIS